MHLRWLFSVAVVLLLAAPVAGASPAHGRLLARQYVTATSGGAVTAAPGIQLYVPPGTMKKNGYVAIVAHPHHRYALNINVPWSGSVRVTLPLRSRSDAVLHRLGNVWIPEGTRRGEASVWVDHLSLFSTLASKVAGALCLDWSFQKVLACLAEKGIQWIDKSLATWIAQKISSSCTAAVIADAGGYGVAITLFKSSACVPNAVDGPPATTPSTTSTPSAPPSTVSPPTPPMTPQQPPPPPVVPAYYVYRVYGTCADGACGLYIRSGPGYSNYASIGSLREGDELDIVCQAIGEAVGPSPKTGNTSSIWDQLTDGGWVSDLYATTPNVGTWSPPIPEC